MAPTHRNHKRIALSIGVAILGTWLTFFTGESRAKATTSPRLGAESGSGKDARYGNFQRMDLFSFRAEGSLLKGANFTQSNLENCVIRRAEAQESIFVKTNLSHCDLRQVDFSSADFSGAQMVGVDLRLTDLSHANLRDSNLEASDLRGARLGHANFQNARWKNSKFDASTRLPFSRDRANQMGMIYLGGE